MRGSCRWPYRDNSFRTMAAPATMACIFPSARSRRRYLRPQSGRHDDAISRHMGQGATDAGGDDFWRFDTHIGEVKHTEQDGLARQVREHSAIEVCLRRLDRDLLDS